MLQAGFCNTRAIHKIFVEIFMLSLKSAEMIKCLTYSPQTLQLDSIVSYRSMISFSSRTHPVCPAHL